jgi:hypothetical protein
MSKATPTKPGDDTDTGAGASAPTPLASTVNPSTTAIRAATIDPDQLIETAPAPSIAQLLQRVTELESAVAALLDDLAIAIPDLRAPSPIPSATPQPSGAYALQPASTAIETLRERATTGDRQALLRYLRLRRS